MINRTALVTGPARIDFASSPAVSFISKEDVAYRIALETVNLTSSAHGIFDKFVTEVGASVEFTPVGEWETAALPVIWPYANMAVGASVFGATDKALVIDGLDGEKVTFVSAAITKMPDIILSANKTMLGSIGFTMIRKLATDWETGTVPSGATPSLYQIEAINRGVTPFATPLFTAASVIVQKYLATWGSRTGFAAFETFDGWTISFTLNLKPIPTDSGGLTDMRFESVECTAKCIPLGPSSVQIADEAKIQGTGNPRGRRIGASGADLVITGTGVSVTLNNANIVGYGGIFGPSTLRNGECMWQATRTLDGAGAQEALFVLSV